MCTTHGAERTLSDMTADQLIDLEQGVLWATRLWFRAPRESGNVLPAINEVLREIGAPAHAALPFAALLGLLSRGAVRRLDFHCPKCRKLGLDEEAFLSALATFQDGDDVAATLILRQWLPPVAVPSAAQFAREFALVLAQADCVLPRRRTEGARISTLKVAAGTDRGATLVH